MRCEPARDSAADASSAAPFRSRRVIADHGSADRRETTIAPTTPVGRSNGAASMWVSPYALRTCSAIRSATAWAAPFAVAVAPDPGRPWKPTGRREVLANGSCSPVMASRVVEGGTPGRALKSVAWSAFASGLRRAMTMWSTPAVLASSSAMAPTMASSETDRDSPERIRANDSASARLLASRSATARR